ncbi:uncharacterized protein G2W53_038627 [Senna tora]|uniref:Uncharacterized protein n=1 Tax=Senna tora TaxID=362788 RepID=A0A834W5D4_9FABA|nr:uncharacterized protein G2W53_038627 [Senna tora]
MGDDEITGGTRNGERFSRVGSGKNSAERSA